MAKFINFPVTGGFSNIAVPISTPSMDGDNLLAAESIVSVSVAVAGIAAGANRMLVTLQLNGIAGSSVCTLTVGTDSVDTPIGNLPAVATAARIKEAINKAITANPGGVKSTAVLPQDSAINTAYSFANTLYFKSFSVA
jgi:hypothetical protein